jgi:uncharacterized protein (TIGR02996 family)
MDNPEYAGLMRTILQQPDDDSLRLILADWLEEHGDPDRAEYIRLQVRRAGLDELDPEGWRLDYRAVQLSELHHERWLAECPNFEDIKVGGRRERGLPNLASVKKPSALPEHEEALFAALPIDSLIVYTDVERGQEGMGEAFLRCRHLHRIRRLDLDGMTSARRLALPALSERMPELREFDMSEGAHEDELPEVLGQCRGWPKFEKLRMYRGLFSERGWRALAASPIFGRLRDLNISRCSLRPEGLRILLAAPRQPPLRSLNLNENDLSEGSLIAFLERDWPDLEDLDLSFNDIFDQGIRALAQTTRLPRLRKLDIGLLGFGNYGMARLADGPALASLRSLSLLGGEFGKAGIEALARAAWLPGLVELDVFDFPTGGAGLKALAKAPLTGLRRLRMVKSKLADSAIFALLDAPWLASLLELDLGNNSITSKAAKAMAEAPQLDGLLRLSLRENKFSARVAEQLRERFGDRVIVKYDWEK